MASKRKDAPPPPIVRKEARGLSPVSAYDAELIMSDPLGTEYDLVPRTKRSVPHHRLYWQALRIAVNSTGRWPNSKALHRDLKITLGYVEKAVNLNTGEVLIVPDSIAFDQMSQKDFAEYFDKAMAKLGEALGFDALSFVDR